MASKRIQVEISGDASAAEEVVERTRESLPVSKVVATETFRAVVNGYSDLFTAGETIIDADDPIAKQFPERFAPVQRVRPEVEDASAAPGVKRGARS